MPFGVHTMTDNILGLKFPPKPSKMAFYRHVRVSANGFKMNGVILKTDVIGVALSLEQSSRPGPQSELHRSCFQAPAKDISVRTVPAHPANGGGEFRRYAIQIYTSTLALTWIFDIVPCVKEWQEGRERLDEGTTNVRGKGEQEWQGRKGSHTWYGSVFRTSVFGWRTFPDLRLIYGWYLTTLWIKCPLWVNQPGQFSLLGR